MDGTKTVDGTLMCLTIKVTADSVQILHIHPVTMTTIRPHIVDYYSDKATWPRTHRIKDSINLQQDRMIMLHNTTMEDITFNNP
jgi:hypothetical protein